MIKPKKKNQHYIPQYYFKNFNDGKRFILSLVLNKREIIPNCSISGQASKSYFYGDSDFENQVFAIENQLRKKLQEVIKTNSITNGNRAGLMEYILYQEARTSKKREQNYEAWKHIEVILGVLDTTSIEQARKNLSKEELDKVEPDEKFWQWRQMQLSIDSYWQLKDLNHTLLKNHTKTPFVFSDAPVVILNPHMDKYRERGVTGIFSKGIIIVFPLSKNHCTLLYDADVYKFKPQYQNKRIKKTSALEISQKDVAIINNLQLLNADNCVYSDDNDALSALLNLQMPDSQSRFECRIQEHPNHVIEVRGSFNERTKFPELPFFKYTKADKFEPARPAATKEYRKRFLERLARIKSPTFMDKILNTKDKHAMYDLLSINSIK